MTHGSPAAAVRPEHVPWLDGVRGVAAFWVLASHVSILAGMRWIPVLSWGATAVDLFMLLSGFLMTHLALNRVSQDPWQAPHIWLQFWIRRVFRIVPLYYLLLIVALLVGPSLGNMREVIANYWPGTATPPGRYFDHTPMNIFAHTMLYFGADPRYAFNTPLPDWSIGLELQYYAAFPFIIIAALRWGALRSGALVIAGCFATALLYPEFFARFEMPSFLPIKLHVFLIGSWIAFGRSQGRLGRNLLMSLALTVALFAHSPDGQSLATVVLVLGMFYLMNDGTLPGTHIVGPITEVLRTAFSSRPARFLGDTSYCVYLVHLLLLIPVASLLAEYPAYRALSETSRFFICLTVVTPPVFLIASVLHRYVERPGIRLGARVAKLTQTRQAIVAAAGEQP